MLNFTTLWYASLVVWAGSEVLMARLLRASATGGGQDRDRRSFWALWATIAIVTTSAGFAGAYQIGALPISWALPLHWCGLGLLLFGLGLRWIAILTLRRFFTVDVAIRKDHKVVDHGLYRFVRHPSYSGALLSFLGFGLGLVSWVSLLLVTVPILAVFLFRIRLEEKALEDALGDTYRNYRLRTSRLIPWLY